MVIPVWVVTPVIFTLFTVRVWLFKFVAPRTLKSPATYKSLPKVPIPVKVDKPAIFKLSDEVTVTIPADKAVTLKFSPKFIVPAVPTRVPSFLTTTPSLVLREPTDVNGLEA